MKYLKYILFSMVIFLSATCVFKAASCSYGDTNLYFECDINGCVMKGNSANNMMYDSATNHVTQNDIKACTSIYGVINTKIQDNPMFSDYNESKPSILGLYGNKTDAEAFQNGNTNLIIMEYKSFGKIPENLAFYNGSTCSYANSYFRYTCTVINSKIDCKLICNSTGAACRDEQVGSYTNKINPSSFIDESTGSFACPETIYYTYDDSKYVTGGTVGTISDEELDGNKVDKFVCNGKCENAIENEDAEVLSLNDYNGEVCTFTNNVFKYTCKITDGQPVCVLTCVEGSNCTFDISNVKNELTENDFFVTGKYACPEYVYVKTSNGKVESISTLKGSGAALQYSSKATPNFHRPGSGDSGEIDDNLPSQQVVDNFCSGTVLSIFTILGWVFFTIKIVVPIILLVFATIDLIKAVIASKDDEIKKSLQTIVKRAIAGIVIFFIPTMLSFVVNLFDNDDIYKGDFGDCTKCMLEPTNKNLCKSIGEVQR